MPEIDPFEYFKSRLDDIDLLLAGASTQPRSEYTGGFESKTVANLPSTGQAGQVFWVSNGRKSGEGVGAGTGVIGFWNSATNQWLRVEDNAQVQA